MDSPLEGWLAHQTGWIIPLLRGAPTKVGAGWTFHLPLKGTPPEENFGEEERRGSRIPHYPVRLFR